MENDNCAVCDKAVSKNDSDIVCSVCCKPVHNDQACSNMQPQTWKAKSGSKRKVWACKTCRKKNSDDTYETNDGTEHIMMTSPSMEPKDSLNNPEFYDFLTKKFNELGEKIVNMSNKMSDVDSKLTCLSEQVNKVEGNQAKLEASFLELKTEVGKVSDELAACKKENQKMKGEILVIQGENKNLTSRLADLEQHSRKNNVIISNIDKKEKADAKQLVMEIAKNLNVVLNSEDILEAHDLPSRYDKTLVVRFKNSTVKSSFTKEKHKAHLKRDDKEVKVYINDHLAPYFKSLLQSAKARAKVFHYKFVWFKKDAVLVRKDETTQKIIKIRSLDDIYKIEKLTPPPIPDPSNSEAIPTPNTEDSTATVRDK